MDKVKNKKLYPALLRYLVPCFIICGIGVLLLDLLTGYLMDWYMEIKQSEYAAAENLVVYTKASDDLWIYKLMSFGRSAVIALWAVFCLWETVRIYYHREISEPIEILKSASNRILGDDLDFTVECRSGNELGQLCGSFETMRKNLYDSNYELWKSLEERKRLNSAFSHDLRTPITVLKGYAELADRFEGKLSAEKQTEILGKMSGQIKRLESYTDKMSSIHKLEDIIPEEKSFSFGDLCGQISETGRLVCGDIPYTFNCEGDSGKELFSDPELIMQVFENIISNAVRYTGDRICCSASSDDDTLKITVADNGRGFSDEALRKAWQPFYRDNNEDEKEHFGLGLYMCRLLCRKCGGDLSISNGENGGGEVTAVFSIKKTESR